MTDGQMAELAKYEAVDDWLYTSRMLVDPAFAEWAAELAYEEHAARLDTLDQAAMEHGLA